MSRNTRKGKLQQTQKTITPFTIGNTKMADDPEAVLNLQTLQKELQASKEAVLAEIKAEICTSQREIKTDMASLRNETKADIQSLRDELTGELAQLRAAHIEVNDQWEEMGKSLGETMDRVAALEKAQLALTKTCKNLQEKCLDLENRSRRRNIRLVGVAEGSEDSNMLSFVPAFFREVLNSDNYNFESPMVIDRAHRTLGPKPNQGERPRTILVRLHYFTDKQKILDAAKTKGKLLYKGRQVHIFPDVSPEVGKMRAAFNDIKKKFRDAGLTYSLFYPARLAVTVDGIRHTFDSPQAAWDFYNQKVAQEG